MIDTYVVVDLDGTLVDTPQRLIHALSYELVTNLNVEMIDSINVGQAIYPKLLPEDINNLKRRYGITNAKEFDLHITDTYWSDPDFYCEAKCYSKLHQQLSNLIHANNNNNNNNKSRLYPYTFFSALTARPFSYDMQHLTKAWLNDAGLSTMDLIFAKHYKGGKCDVLLKLAAYANECCENNAIIVINDNLEENAEIRNLGLKDIEVYCPKRPWNHNSTKDDIFFDDLYDIANLTRPFERFW